MSTRRNHCRHEGGWFGDDPRDDRGRGGALRAEQFCAPASDGPQVLPAQGRAGEEVGRRSELVDPVRGHRERVETLHLLAVAADDAGESAFGVGRGRGTEARVRGQLGVDLCALQKHESHRPP